jgi:hypothetical protein
VATGDPGPPYRFSFLSAADEKLRALARRAVGLGLTAEFIRDLDYIRLRLRADPTDWGDPLFDYRHLGMTHYRGRSELLYTYFSVNEAGRAVFVQDFDINPYSTLAGGLSG